MTENEAQMDHWFSGDLIRRYYAPAFRVPGRERVGLRLWEYCGTMEKDKRFVVLLVGWVDKNHSLLGG